MLKLDAWGSGKWNIILNASLTPKGVNLEIMRPECSKMQACQMPLFWKFCQGSHSHVPTKFPDYFGIITIRWVIPSEAVTEPCGQTGQIGSVRARTSTQLEHLTWNDSGILNQNPGHLFIQASLFFAPPLMYYIWWCPEPIQVNLTLWHVYEVKWFRVEDLQLTWYSVLNIKQVVETCHTITHTRHTLGHGRLIISMADRPMQIKKLR